MNRRTCAALFLYLALAAGAPMAAGARPLPAAAAHPIIEAAEQAGRLQDGLVHRLVSKLLSAALGRVSSNAEMGVKHDGAAKDPSAASAVASGSSSSSSSASSSSSGSSSGSGSTSASLSGHLNGSGGRAQLVITEDKGDGSAPKKSTVIFSANGSDAAQVIETRDDGDDDNDDASDDDDGKPAGVQIRDQRRKVVLDRNGKVLTVDLQGPAAGPRPFAPDTDGPATEAEPVSVHMKGASSVDVLSEIAQKAGWSVTLVGVGREKIDVDLDDVEPSEAMRQVLVKANCLGVLHGDKLVVIAATAGHTPGLLIEAREHGAGASSAGRHRSADLVKVGGDVIIPSGTVIQGDALAVLGSVEVESGAVVQGSTAAVLGSVTVQPGGVVLGDTVAVLGENDIQRGGQVLGDHVQVGLGRLFSSAPARHRGFLSRLGPFGLFPTLALFAVVYLLGLGALRAWPDRMRTVGAMLIESPIRSFVIGFLLWLLFLPVLILLVASVVGILLLPLVPLAVALAVMLGACALALRIGEALPAGEGHRFVPPAALAMGLAAMLLVSLVPWIGVPLLVLVVFVGPGAVISSRFGRQLPSP